MALEALEGPPFPEALRVLWHRFERLDAMRSVGQFGLERFTPGHIMAGAALFGWRFAPHEVEALVRLDLVTMHPEERDEEKPADRPPDVPWPERKG